MSKYQQEKDRARQIAKDWQQESSEISLSWEGVMIATAYLYRLARRYGLIREFRENAII
jgi:hypothetical protein